MTWGGSGRLPRAPGRRRRARRINACWTLALLVACGGDGEAGSEAPPPPPDSVAAPTFRRLEWLSAPYDVERERGVGVAFPGPPVGAPDTVLVFEAPEAGAPVAARLIRQPSGEYALEVSDALSGEPWGGALEYGYEEVGLPLLDPPPQDATPADWLRVAYARTRDGQPLEGWVRYDRARVEVLLWREHLPALPLFFAWDDSVRFHASPGGPDVEVRLAAGQGTPRFDYILHPLETRDAWMRVEVVTPSDYCFDPPAPRRDTLWVRWLDERGRPRLWYYTRGC